jgi:SpoVK/Ycf46/Vps4 family AAA+-type ATPase
MANAEQLKALVESFATHDEATFYRVALQMAAHEARMGHDKLARDLRDLVDRGRQAVGTAKFKRPTPLARPKGELEELLSVSYSKLCLRDLVLTDGLAQELSQVVHEQLQRDRLAQHGLSPRHRLLLAGPPGTGKSLTARALAGELSLPLFCVRFDALITRYLGETAAKLRLVFDAMQELRGVYFFDEFDAIGAQRALPNEVGEIRRVLNSFLQFIEEEQSTSLVLAATNHSEILDRALYRRFDSVLVYELPDEARALETLRRRLASFRLEVDWSTIAGSTHGLSYADLVSASEDAARRMVLEDRGLLRTEDLLTSLQNRKNVQVSGKG